MVIHGPPKLQTARLAFHLHRVTASVCRVTHLARLLPPPLLDGFASRFDSDQRSAFSAMSDVPMTTDVASQIALPFRHGGIGLTPLKIISPAAYAASLLDTAEARADLLRTRNPALTPASLINEVQAILVPLLPRCSGRTRRSPLARPCLNATFCCGAGESLR